MVTVALLLIFTGPWLVYLFTPVPDQLAEYRNYSMCAGFALLASLLPDILWPFALVVGCAMTHYHAMCYTGFIPFWTRSRETATGDKSRANQEIGAWLKIEGKLVEAEPYFREALRLNPSLGPAIDNLASICFATGRQDEGFALVEQLTHVCPRYVPGWQYLGMLYEQRQRWEDAERCFEIAVNLYKDVPVAANHLGLLQYRKGNFQSALEWFQRARKYHPDHHEFVFNAATVLAKMDRKPEANEIAKRLPRQGFPLTPEMIRPEGIPA